MLLLTPVESTPSDAGPVTRWCWAQTPDGRALLRSGEASLLELPDDPDCVLVVPAHRLSWHQVSLPKVATTRLRTTLEGILEEGVLDDLASLHLALAPSYRAGVAQSVWVAVVHKAWLTNCLQTLEQAQRAVMRIIPAAAPTVTDFVVGLHTSLGRPWCTVCSPQGVLALPMPDTESSVPTPERQTARTWAHAASGLPEAAPTHAWAEAAHITQAEQLWPEWPWAPAPATQAWLLPLQAGWNLAQFDLKLSTANRRGKKMQRLLRTLCFDATWRPLRWGLVAFVLINAVGLNVVAWQTRHQLKAQQADMHALLTQTFPHVQLVLDAPLQMQRELDLLRQQHGQLGNADLESLLRALATTGPAATFERLNFSTGQVQFQGWALATESQADVQAQVRALGWQAPPMTPAWNLTWEERP